MAIQHNDVMIFRQRRAKSGDNVLLTGAALDNAVRQRALSVTKGEITRDDFLLWMHDHVTHDGPEKYLDLVEMACIPEEADAGKGRWWRESEEAEPLREWTNMAISAVACGEQQPEPPKNWERLVYSKYPADTGDLL